VVLNVNVKAALSRLLVYLSENICDGIDAPYKDALTLISMDAGLTKAIKAAGNGAALARELGITRSALSQWRRVPQQHIIAIERITGVHRKVLRPDLYPPERRA
jgi:hypothetical protein